MLISHIWMLLELQTQFNTLCDRHSGKSTLCWNDECYAVLHCGSVCLHCECTCDVMELVYWLLRPDWPRSSCCRLTLVHFLCYLRCFHWTPETKHPKHSLTRRKPLTNNSCNASGLFASSGPNKEQCSVGGACTHQQQQQQTANTNRRWTEWSCSSVSPWRWRL